MRHPHSSIIITALVATAVAAAQTFTPSHKLRMAEMAITQLYVDTVNSEQLAEDAIRGMLEKLDPHSSYSTVEETRELNEPLEGNFSGIGITFNMNRDTLYVIQTVAGGPSERVGVLPGDRMISVNDTAIAGVKMKNRDVMKRLRGPKGTDVNVKILRHAGAGVDTIDFTITRADIPIKSVDAAYMASPVTGYIRLNKFAAETPKEIRKAISDLKKKGMENLILDLTDNGGGYLQAAVDMLGELLPPASLAVYTEGRASGRHDAFTSPAGSRPLLDGGRLVIMVNQFSASASEITSGAVQDWDRGVIVGRRTFGKGLVQRPVPFPDGSMMRLTVAHYYTPTGRDIQKPYVKGEKGDYDKDLLERLNQGELMHRDSIHHSDSLRVSTLVNGRTIYGGGGITPDQFVPLDTMENSRYFRNVMAKGLINRFVISYVDTHRKNMKKQYGNGDRFISGFETSPEMIDSLRSLADAEKVEFNQEEFDRARPLFAMIIKALIGRDVFDDDTYYKVYNSHDPIFREALGIIESPRYDQLLQDSHQK